MKSEKSKNQGQSPFRYPGGKAFLFSYLKEEIEKVSTDGSFEYAEPYAGGAGAAIKLLHNGIVRKIRINDADIRIYAAWKSMIEETDRFVSSLHDCEVSVKAWKLHAEIVKNPYSAKNIFDIGFSTFFLNRVNRSGIIIGAGPIGGLEQNGNWKIDARLNKKALTEKILWIGKNAERIKLSNLDGLMYLRNASSRKYNDKTFYFIDPPYVGAGNSLYLNLMNEKKHRQLGQFLESGSLKHWTMTYDDCPLIHEIYSNFNVSNLQVIYSLQTKRKQNELLIDNK